MVKTKIIDYPNIKLDDALNSVKILIEKLNGEAKNPDSFASLLGHNNAKSSAFITKIGDLRRYNLIEKRGSIKATSLAKSITHPLKEEEKQNAINQIIMGVDIWKLIYQKIGRKVPPENEFWTQIVEICNVDRNTAIKEADRIRKLYIDVMTYYKEEGTITSSTYEDKPKNIFEKDQTKMSENMLYFKTGEINMSLPKSDKNIKMLKNFLNSLLEDPDKNNDHEE